MSSERHAGSLKGDILGLHAADHPPVVLMPLDPPLEFIVQLLQLESYYKAGHAQEDVSVQLGTISIMILIISK